MLEIIKGWMHRYFSDYEAVVLLFLLVLGFVVVVTMGHMLAPALAALVLAFLLQGLVNWLEHKRLPHALAVSLVFIAFITLFLLCLLVLVPLIWEQMTHLLNEVPRMVKSGQQLLNNLPDMYPGFVSDNQIMLLADQINRHLAGFGQWALSFSLSRLPGAMNWLIYLILVPIMVFFFLKDKKQLLAWVSGFLPARRRLLDQVAEEMNCQIANYIRGKAIEIVIVGTVTFIAFGIMGLNYAALLGVMVGLSVLVPYIGAAVVTVPVLMVGFFQWGLGDYFVALMVVYGVIQALDGNVLVPILFSEAVNLHPIAILLAVLVFGGFWGFWGVFFAIPLATLFKAVINAWPKVEDIVKEPSNPT
ncbi:hypothetical protein CI610_00980 [invertebrate metagenome]|uniref:AI-2 transport protein TqsA n=1 Tax=invertebrate metagenome TaxID=1711999 RepID=A0A2H9T9V8_9ZZZZ